MPTGAEFEEAAMAFDTAADLIVDVVVAADAAAASDALQGGTLSAQVSDRIAAAAGDAANCRLAVIDAADLCRERAGIIADYEYRLSMYRQAEGYYERAKVMHRAAQVAYAEDTTGTVAAPGPAPRPPRKPEAPPDWADVVRL